MRTSVIRASMLGFCGFACFAAAPAAAREYPWCLQLGGRAVPSGTFASLASPAPSESGALARLRHLASDTGGGRNCGFDSYEQCLRARVGVGGFCEPNLFFRADPIQSAPHRARRRGA